MPTYEYKCSACGHQFERFQSIKADPVKKCPECGKNKVNRLIGTGAGLIFKGSGFYITDYRDSSYKEKAKSESGTSSSGDASSNGKADSKAAGTGTAAASSESSGKSATSSTTPAKSESKPAGKSESPKAKK